VPFSLVWNKVSILDLLFLSHGLSVNLPCKLVIIFFCIFLNESFPLHQDLTEERLVIEFLTQMFPIKSIIENHIPSLRHSHCFAIHNVAYKAERWNKWQIGSQEIKVKCKWIKVSWVLRVFLVIWVFKMWQGSSS
jgi:hypothetical protein